MGGTLFDGVKTLKVGHSLGVYIIVVGLDHIEPGHVAV